ncbi:MAG: hypothetical protein JOZ60_05880, partial [Verrucomicrobia bacterium]|nr:hypothetical protein [Verrucomicrobiota bacterium]
MINLALTVALSIKYIPRALLSLLRGKGTVELLYLASAVLTAVTFEFLPAAVVYWFLRFWPRRTAQLYDLHHTRFLARYHLRPRRVWVEREGAAIETRVEKLNSRSVITLNAGDIVPGDGLVLSGSAQVDERLLSGTSQNVTKSENGAIYAGTRIVEGGVRIRVYSIGPETAAERVAAWQKEALERLDSEHRAGYLADRTAFPILALGALGLVQGGLSTAKAAIRPDYMTGPAISEKMSGLAAVIRAASNGIVVGGKADLERFLKCNSIVLDDSVNWHIPQSDGEPSSRAIFSEGFAESVFLSRKS